MHGNLHEGNVLLSEGGAKVGDFALARAARARRAATDDLRQFGALMRRVARVGAELADQRASCACIEGLAGGAYTSAAEALGRTARAAPRPRGPSVRRLEARLARASSSRCCSASSRSA